MSATPLPEERLDDLIAVIASAPCTHAAPGAGLLCDANDETVKHPECVAAHLRASDNHHSVLFGLGFEPGPISGGRDHWVSRSHPYDPAIDPPHGALVRAPAPLHESLVDAFVAAKLAGTKKLDSAEWGYAFRSNEQAAAIATDVALDVVGPVLSRQAHALDRVAAVLDEWEQFINPVAVLRGELRAAR